MGILLAVVGGALAFAGFVCAIIILIDAFKNEIWKGIVGLLCSIYLLYYGIVEFNHEKKWLIFFTWIIGGTAGYFIMAMGLALMAGQTSVGP